MTNKIKGSDVFLIPGKLYKSIFSSFPGLVEIMCFLGKTSIPVKNEEFGHNIVSLTAKMKFLVKDRISVVKSTIYVPINTYRQRGNPFLLYNGTESSFWARKLEKIE